MESSKVLKEGSVFLHILNIDLQFLPGAGRQTLGDSDESLNLVGSQRRRTRSES